MAISSALIDWTPLTLVVAGRALLPAGSPSRPWIYLPAHAPLLVLCRLHIVFDLLGPAWLWPLVQYMQPTFAFLPRHRGLSCIFGLAGTASPKDLGRRSNIPHRQRFCTTCNSQTIRDGFHLVLEYPAVHPLCDKVAAFVLDAWSNDAVIPLAGGHAINCAFCPGMFVYSAA